MVPQNRKPLSASEVAQYVRATLDGDKASRRGLYEKFGLPLDDSVKQNLQNFFLIPTHLGKRWDYSRAALHQ